MASKENRWELDEKVTALVATRFGGDYRAAFAHYDGNGDRGGQQGRVEGVAGGRGDR
ncbi:hypothetical protein PX52LOC_07659 [Limnoglobus roseus]|uniref:Uncharacterized protein n=1 Tax=Limnoglobus roseus TaxID=2598579 RepID=A0A5C1ATK8_9BACT|nr:hypothetical protein PX52LOC_07659 [Limnoglobus roseus]